MTPSDWTFAAPDALAALWERKAFARHLRSVARAASDIEAAEVIYSELVANVIRHAPGPIWIVLSWMPDGKAALHVRDTGSGFKAASATPRDVLGDGGRGLHIVTSLAERVFVSREDEGSVVTAVLPVTAA